MKAVDNKKGTVRCISCNKENSVFETEHIIILVQHRQKNEPTVKMTNAGELQASEEKVKALARKTLITTIGQRPATWCHFV